MAGITLTAVGIFSAVPTFWQLPSAFLTGTAAAAGIGLINSIGNLSGFAGPYLTGWLKDLTGSFQTGMLVIALSMALAGIVVVALGARTRTGQPGPPAATAVEIPARPVDSPVV
jgi:nitrate/nitrite transporter NarK